MKRSLCLLLALMMLLTCGIITASAAKADVAPTADDGNTFSFNANTAGWSGFDYIAFHIWGDDEDFFDWGSRRQRGTDPDGDNIWTYDLSAAGITLDPEKPYYVIFYSSTGMQTYNLICGAACYGDVAYCTGNMIENPVDSEKLTAEVMWYTQDATVYGPELAITSIGNVVGSACPASKSRYSMFVTFLKDTLTNARFFSGKDDQALIDDTASALGLSTDEVISAIAEAGVTVDWKAPTDPDDPIDDVIMGDANDDGEVSILDATRIQRYLAELAIESDVNMIAADVDGDEEVTIFDATRIQRYLAELCELDGSPYGSGHDDGNATPDESTPGSHGTNSSSSSSGSSSHGGSGFVIL